MWNRYQRKYDGTISTHRHCLRDVPEFRIFQMKDQEVSFADDWEREPSVGPYDRGRLTKVRGETRTRGVRGLPTTPSFTECTLLEKIPDPFLHNVLQRRVEDNRSWVSVPVWLESPYDLFLRYKRGSYFPLVIVTRGLETGWKETPEFVNIGPPVLRVSETAVVWRVQEGHSERWAGDGTKSRTIKSEDNNLDEGET